MLIREAIEDRLAVGAARDLERIQVRLPLSLKVDRVPVRTAMFQRLAASRQFALGDRSGVLRAAQGRSGRAFRMDVRQRVIVKALVSKHVGKGAARAGALAAHVAYLGRSGAGVDGTRPDFFDSADDGVEASVQTRAWSGDRHHFRFIISPEHGDRIIDLRGYVREVMDRVSADLGEPALRWVATCHYDTDQPHAHVLVRGGRADGRDLVIPRDYMGYGFRARAQEVAQERLGDLSRVEAERRVWKETEADRFTGFDRRLLAAVDAGGMVDDGVGVNDAWAALTRGRLRHLEGLGLAVRTGRRYRLDPQVKMKLRTLQARRDIIRTINQRRLEGAREVRPLGAERVKGVVVKTGFHDEAGAAPFVVVRDTGGVEHYGRLKIGGRSLTVGEAAVLTPGPQGLAGRSPWRGGIWNCEGMADARISAGLEPRAVGKVLPLPSDGPFRADVTFLGPVEGLLLDSWGESPYDAESDILRIGSVHLRPHVLLINPRPTALYKGVPATCGASISVGINIGGRLRQRCRFVMQRLGTKGR